MNRSKVYIVQELLKRDIVTGEMVLMMDFRPAAKYGEPVVLLNSGRVSLTPGPTIDKIRDKLRNFSDDDYIISSGDPSAIFAAAMVIADINNGRCKLLKWDKSAKEYIMVQMDIHHRTRKEN